MPDQYGLKIAPSGVNVLTASEEQLTFISSRKILKVAGVGISTGPVNIAHNLGYAPAFLAFRNYTSGSEQRVMSGGNGNDSIYANSNNIVIPSTQTFKYYVLYKPAT